MGRQNSRLRPKMPVNLTQQRLLASKIMKVGKNKVWLDPLSSVVISAANSNSSIRKLIKEGTIVKVPMTVRSRFRANQKLQSERKADTSVLEAEKEHPMPDCPPKPFTDRN